MNKTKLIFKNFKLQFTEQQAINRKIAELKKEFTQFTSSRVGSMYKILNEIIKLKQQTNPKYAPRSLEWEKDMNLGAMQIRYIFTHQYLSTYSKKLINEGLITDSTICFLIFRFKFLREPEWQNKVVDKFLAGQIRISWCSEMTQEEIKLLLNDKFEFKLDERYFLSAVKNLSSILSRIRERKHLIKDSRFRARMLEKANKLVEELK